MPISIESIEQSVDGRKLVLSFKGVTEDDIENLCNYLNQHPEITSLDVSFNMIGEKGAWMLESNTTLTSINLRSNGLSGSVLKALASKLNLNSLDLSHNNVHPSFKELLTKIWHMSPLEKYVWSKEAHKEKVNQAVFPSLFALSLFATKKAIFENQLAPEALTQLPKDIIEGMEYGPRLFIV